MEKWVRWGGGWLHDGLQSPPYWVQDPQCFISGVLDPEPILGTQRTMQKSTLDRAPWWLFEVSWQLANDTGLSYRIWVTAEIRMFAQWEGLCWSELAVMFVWDWCPRAAGEGLMHRSYHLCRHCLFTQHGSAHRKCSATERRCVRAWGRQSRRPNTPMQSFPQSCLVIIGLSNQ